MGELVESDFTHKSENTQTRKQSRPKVGSSPACQMWCFWGQAGLDSSRRMSRVYRCCCCMQSRTERMLLYMSYSSTEQHPVSFPNEGIAACDLVSSFLSIPAQQTHDACSVSIDKQWHNKSLHNVAKGFFQHAFVWVTTGPACILASCSCFVTGMCLAHSASAYGWHVQSSRSQWGSPSMLCQLLPASARLWTNQPQQNETFQPQPDNCTHSSSRTEQSQ